MFDEVIYHKQGLRPAATPFNVGGGSFCAQSSFPYCCVARVGNRGCRRERWRGIGQGRVKNRVFGQL